jgi:hypothetical protein
MAREIVTWCDIHMDKGERVPAKGVTLTLDFVESTFDLCEECDTRLFAPIRHLVEEYAQPAKAAPRSGKAANGASKEPGYRKPSERSLEPRECPVGNCREVLTTRVKMRHHLTSHGTSLAEVETARGEGLWGEPLDHHCPDCDWKFPTPQGMATHRVKAHGYKISDDDSDDDDHQLKIGA